VAQCEAGSGTNPALGQSPNLLAMEEKQLEQDHWVRVDLACEIKAGRFVTFLLIVHEQIA
jgi:hypothetical protein